MTTPEITVVGGGLAGCEAAYQAALQGVKVRLIEMKPQKYTPAHHSPAFAELVCSNSLRSNSLANAVGLLKEELFRMDSLIMRAAYHAQVPAGSALAVDRTRFSDYITRVIRSHPSITVEEGEVTSLPPKNSTAITVIATGPLTSDALARDIETTFGDIGLHFFDAAAPIVDAASLDYDKVFFASRYGKGEASYLNCPITKEEYDRFYDALIHAEEAPLKEFDRQSQTDLTVFEGCMPVEVMAKRGYETLLYGPLKPVGLPDPRTGKEPFAVVQLRMEDNCKSMFNLVGFQTHLTFPEQRRVFGLIPGLERAEFLRYGVMHRNTYLNSPALLTDTYSVADRPNLFFAGQMTGVEGYLESCASGFVAGLNAARLALGKECIRFSDRTAIGALSKYVSTQNTGKFSPMNVNFGIIAPPEKRIRGGKAAKNRYLSARSLAELDVQFLTF